MALIKCKECGKEMSDTAKKCPHCGYKEKKKVKISKKKLIIIGIALLVIIGGIIAGVIVHNNNLKKETKKYESSLVMAGAETYIYGLIAEMDCYDISRIWYNAIWESKSSYSWGKYSQYYSYDFNSAIRKYQTANKESLDKLDDKKDELGKDIKKLKDMPSQEYKETYDALVDFYGIFSKLVDAAVSPSGNYSNYSKTYNSYSDDFEEAYNKLKVLLPEIEDYKDKNEDTKNDNDGV